LDLYIVYFCFALFLLKAGGMDRASNLPKIQDEERESMFGYVYGVSGPGKFQ